MQTLKNNRDCHLLIWPVSINERKNPHRLTFVAPEQDKIAVGDKITGSYFAEKLVSTYTIKEIKEVRESTIFGKKHYETIATWKMEEDRTL